MAKTSFTDFVPDESRFDWLRKSLKAGSSLAVVGALLAAGPAFAQEAPGGTVTVDPEDEIPEGENVIYYITIMNEFYRMPPMPAGAAQGILKGMYRFRPSAGEETAFKAHLLGSGAILNEALKAQEILENELGIPADVWSVTSYKNLYWDALDAERTRVLQPEDKPGPPYIARALQDAKGVYVAASDYLKAMPASIAKWIPGPLTILGTDGYGRSDTREALRDFFEVDARHIAFAAVSAMYREGRVELPLVKKARRMLDIHPEKMNPLIA